MSPPPLRYDLSGAIVRGLFFEVSIPFDSDQTDRGHGFVPLYAEADYDRASWILPNIKYVPIYRCSIQSEHPHITKRHESPAGQANWYDKTNDIIASMLGEVVFVSDRLERLIREALNARRFAGFELARMKAHYNSKEPFWLRPDTHIFERALLVDRENDRCLNCRHTPLFCAECGSADCPRCGHFNVGAGLYAVGSKYPTDDDMFPREPIPPEGIVLNARLWNGEDYLAYGTCGVITGRLAKFLFDNKARGMWIRPAQAYFPDEKKAKSELVSRAVWDKGPKRIEIPSPQRGRGK